MVTLVGARNPEGAKSVISELIADKKKAADQVRQDSIEETVDKVLTPAQKPLKGLFLPVVVQELGMQEVNEDAIKSIIQEIVKKDEGIQTTIKTLSGPGLILGKGLKEEDKGSANVEVIEQ
jgi:hypothetical protein